VLERWRRAYPEKQIHVGLYEDIASDPVDVLRGVCSHIGADTDVDWSRFPHSRVINRGQRPPMPDEYRSFLDEMYRDELSKLEERAVSRWREAARARQRAALTALSLLGSISDELAELCARVF
jgi:hypothetical protein